MKRSRICAMILTIMLLLSFLCACAKGEVVVATVNGEPLYKWQLDLLVEEQQSTYESMNGIDLSKPENWRMLKMFKEGLLDEMINQQVAMEKAKELGLDKLSDEELADTEKQYEEQVEANIAYYAQKYPDDPKAREKGKADFEKVLAKKKLTPERLKENINDNKILMKLYQQEFASYKPSEEEIQQWYDDNVAEQKAKFDANPALFGEEGGALQLYVPEGYVRVRHVLIGLSEDTQSKIRELSSKLGEVTMAIISLGDNNAAEADRLAKQLSDIEAQISAERDAGLQAVKARAEEVLQMAKSGTDFEYLIEEYNDDPGMTTAPAKQLGYLVCPQTTMFYQEFTNAALALENVGDVSELIATDAGYHIIRLYEKLTPGASPLERIHDTIADIIMKNSSFTPMVEAREEWKKTMEIVKYLDKV